MFSIYYQFGKVCWSFGDEVLDLKLWCCHEQLSLFLRVTISLPAILCAFLLLMSKADKLLEEMELVAHDNNTIIFLVYYFTTRQTFHRF